MRGRPPKVVPMDGSQEKGWKVPTRPKSLMGRPVAIAEWKRICQSLYDRGLWGKSDLKVIELYCQAAQVHADAVEDYQEQGPTVAGDRGGVKANPAARIMQWAHEACARRLGDLGLTAVAAAKPGVGDAGEDDFMKWLKGQSGGNQ